ncbi:hypothetical protein [Actinomadura sp. DC4]|uniref:hypothetical protein n=1 Tax=Actinomadura sp. DC4 TaxID=3055069 RepID=UPI0025B11167|nr:hypothetical protein [Actinomadura sp. DC4]MDN3354379.1 hypothetical protein [Actinomadura sp. DC4]
MPIRAKAKPTEPGPNTAPDRPISITAVIDPVAALAAGTVRGNLYLYDTNKTGGSTGLGGEELRTRVRKGDQLLWNTLPLECETYAAISAILIDAEICEPKQKVYPGTDISYWSATVKRDLTEPVPYRIQFRLGTVTEPITTETSPALVGSSAGPGATDSVKESA